MDGGRLKLEARGEPLLLTRRELLLGDEEPNVLPAMAARLELESLSPDSVRRLVAAFASRFPNACEPDKTRRIMAYVQQRVSLGAIALVKKH